MTRKIREDNNAATRSEHTGLTMAKDANDNVTNELFNELERNVMMQALQSHIKTLKRQANNEPNEAIKLIREAETKKFINIMNKMQGLIP